MNAWLLQHLACPRDRQRVTLSEKTLVCPRGHRYPVVDDIPVMLIDEVERTHPYVQSTLDKVSRWLEGAPIDEDHPAGDDPVDGFVQHEVPFTSGFLYFPIQYRLKRYPIPAIRLPAGGQKRFLDIGCNWGRWSVAAARIGYRPVGIDPGIDAVLAAKRVAMQLGVEIDLVIGDARFLPFTDDAFDTAFSHSVFSSFSKENVQLALAEVSRVLRHLGTSLLQMPNKYGIRQYQQQWRRGFTEGKEFETRYWSPAELRTMFEEHIGPTKMTADCFFGLGVQPNDVDLLPMRYKPVVYSSEALRGISKIFTPLTKVADSVYLESVNKK